MGVLTKKYVVSISFCPETGDVSKILGTPRDFEQKFEFF
jgi:hypothetical protein